MICPKCNYDMFPIYDEVIRTGKDSKKCKIINIHTVSNLEILGGTDWDVECICPKCKTKWTFSDGDY